MQEAAYLVHLLLLLVKLIISLQLALPRAAQRQSQRMCFWSNSLDAFETSNEWGGFVFVHIELREHAVRQTHGKRDKSWCRRCRIVL